MLVVSVDDERMFWRDYVWCLTEIGLGWGCQKPGEKSMRTRQRIKHLLHVGDLKVVTRPLQAWVSYRRSVFLDKGDVVLVLLARGKSAVQRPGIEGQIMSRVLLSLGECWVAASRLV